MFKKILIATDGSEQSGSAVIEAINMAAVFKSEIYFLHVLKMMVVGGMDASAGVLSVALTQKIEDNMKKYMQTFKGMAMDDGAVKCETIIRQGIDFENAIIDEVKKKLIDIVMIGRRNKTNIFKRLLFGSLTGQLLQHSPCSILIVPLASLIQWENVMLTLSEKIDNAAAINKTEQIIKFYKTKKLTISILGEIKKDELKIAAEQFSDKFKNEFAGIEINIINVNSEESLIKKSIELNTDIIIVSANEHNSAGKFFKGSIAERIIVESMSGVLAVKK